MKIAAVEGAGLGLGGILTIVPDLGILAGITMRTIQKLSLVYGFEYDTDDEIADLWVAAASAAGVDISRELLEKEVVNRFVPRVIQRIAVQASTEVVERWAGRMIPVVSSAIGGRSTTTSCAPGDAAASPTSARSTTSAAPASPWPSRTPSVPFLPAREAPHHEAGIAATTSAEALLSAIALAAVTT